MFKSPLSLLMLLVGTTAANAIEINSMFKVADKGGKGTFTVKNVEDKRIFLNVGIHEINVVNGALKKTAYTRENISDWQLSVRPAKTILDPGFEKDFLVEMNCEKNSCEQDRDQVFQLAFVPSPYFPEGSTLESAVQVAIGFAPVFIMPGKEQPLDYDISFNGQQITFVNHGSSMFNARLETCEEGVTNNELLDCIKEVHILGGRNITIDLPESMQGEDIQVVVSSHNDSYRDDLRLKK